MIQKKGNKVVEVKVRKSALELSKLFKDLRKISVEESNKEIQKKQNSAIKAGF
ncbi:hypothetical protein [Chryseobacterium luteum]|uniref:hypothetical protein n=1 Tax=Chryseobacterium luteum TaxID=421531 RepID=UPI0029346B53|nr:hypothetical protein [Chryseobacterium luteum]